MQGIQSVIYPVKDLAKAKELYGKLLGVEPYFDQPFYVGFQIGAGQEIGLDPNGHAEGMTGPVSYWKVEDIQDTLKSFLATGATTHQDAKDVGGGMLMAAVKDADGNTIGLIQLV
ncbi:MAG: VOC family protein [Candidatus Saccharimonadales bacterium]